MGKGRGGNATSRAAKPAPKVNRLNKDVGKRTMGKPIKGGKGRGY